MVYVSQPLLGYEYLRHDKARMILPLNKLLGHLEIPGVDALLFWLVPVGEEHAYFFKLLEDL